MRNMILTLALVGLSFCAMGQYPATEPSPAAAQGQFVGCMSEGRWAETPMLRTTFAVAAGDLAHDGSMPTARFQVAVASLGYHELYVNCKRVGNSVLQPAVSQLTKRALRVVYDITDYVCEGQNDLLLWLGQGWGRVYGTPAAAQVRVEKSAEGRPAAILASADDTWQATPSGYSYTGSWQPLQFGGERCDARVHEAWRTATVYDAQGITVSDQQFEGNSILAYCDPLKVDTLPDGSFLFDFGRTVTGWFQADCLPIPEGEEIAMEYLDHPNAMPPHTEKDIYVSDGSGMHFSNRFHLHAFRYVKVSGLAHCLNSHLSGPIITARACQIGAVDPAGGATFECSDPRLNAIHDMVKYTLSCLTFSGYMVDCPHLERMGYGGDGNSSTMTLQTLWDVRPTYRNWMTAWADAMEPSGDLPYAAPAFRTGGGPYWCSFIVKAPWSTYLNYGDRGLLEDYYGEMKRWMEYVEDHSVDGILQPWPDCERHAWFLGDWLAPDGVDIGGESVLHVSSCMVGECLDYMEQTARLLGHSRDARLFAKRRKRVDRAIHRHFYHPETHTYANGTPLDQAYALFRGLPPDSVTAAQVRAQLIADCHGKYRDHLAVGLVGVPVFTEWCIRERQADLMATLLRQPDYPGYLYMISHGATTTWESWGCGMEGKEDRSRVHNCYNGIGIWFYQALAGIRPDPEVPGYRHFFIDPQPVEGVEWVRATKPTPYGTIAVAITESRIEVTVPQGTSATLFPGTAREQTLPAGRWTVGR